MHQFPILDQFSVTITETHNPFQLPVDKLFSMAARVNKKRSFLFVSKLLGKHIPVHPYTSLLSGAALAILLYRELAPPTGEAVSDDLMKEAVKGLMDPQYAEQAYLKLMDARLTWQEPVKFVGFAETATALGHSMYNVFAGGAVYIHTTREDIPELRPVIQFEEEHSHAVAHRCYAVDESPFSGEGPIVLVDDEITTGRTTLNIIRDIQANYPRKQYIIASLLDWRTERDERAFAELEAELSISITPLCLLKGKMEVLGTPVLQPGEGSPNIRYDTHVAIVHKDDLFQTIHAKSVDSTGNSNTSPYLLYTGRFGLQSGDNDALDTEISLAAEYLNRLRTGQRTLVMGTGEFMYIPMRIAAEMGSGVYYQSTTRSPIYPKDRSDYGIHNGYGYVSPDDPAVENYIYNIAPGQYDEVFVLMERSVHPERMEPMLKVLRQLDCGPVHVICCTSQFESGGDQLESSNT